jgi:hypothetical protein
MGSGTSAHPGSKSGSSYQGPPSGGPAPTLQ